MTRLEYVLRFFPEVRSTPVLDVGCGDGRHLSRFGIGSVGLDARRPARPDPNRPVFPWLFSQEMAEVLKAAPLKTFKYVWCNSVLEHHPNPHEFLLGLRSCLVEDGVLFLGVPLVNRIAGLRGFMPAKISNYFNGFLSQDHINFYRFSTLKHTVQFAGLELTAWYSPLIPFERPPMIGIEPFTMLALRKRKDFAYGGKAYKVLNQDGSMRWKELSDYTTDEVPK